MAGLLYAPARAAAYGLDEEGRLEADLAEAARSTIVWEPSRWEDLRMGADGSLPDGSRFTQQGLEQVCSDLAPGLFRLVLDLSGAARGDGDPADEYSLAEAAAVFNLALRRRFGARIRDRRALVRDPKAGTIDGVVPPGGVVVANADFFRAVRGEVARAGRRVVLVEAAVAGRRLALRYADRGGLLRAPDGEVWRAGFFAASVEAVGEAAARAAPAIYAAAGGLWAVGPPTGGGPPSRLAVGFRAAVEDAARAAACASVPASAVAEGFAALDAAVAVPRGRDADARAAMRRAVAALSRRGVPRRAAAEAVLAARGAATADAPTGDPAAGAGETTWLRLYIALAMLAKSRHAALRERMERAAFDLLSRSKKGT